MFKDIIHLFVKKVTRPRYYFQPYIVLIVKDKDSTKKPVVSNSKKKRLK